MEEQSRLRQQHYCGVVMAPVPVVGPGFVAGRAVWACFVMPETAPVPVPDGFNQGTIVVFNLDANVSVVMLKEIFEAYGLVKEVRETPLKRQQRFVEFFDVRDAARAVVEMDGKEINGRKVVVDFSRPGGHRRRFSSFNSTWNNYSSRSSINSSSSSNGCHYPRISIQQQQQPPTPFNVPKSYRRSSSSASSSSTSTSSQPQHTSKKSSSSTLTSPTWNNNNRSRWSNNHIHRSSSPSPSALSSMAASLSINDGNQDKVMNCINGSSSSSKKVINTSNSPSSAVKSQQQHGMKQSRSRSWNKGSGNGRQKSLLESHFLMNKEAMVDSRTTVMIKNIPNKYSQKLLLNMLDNHCIHCNEQIADGGGGDDDHLPMSSYDFVYLPIDFNNKCNVGYGFVNMTSPEAAWRLYQAFHMQHWEVFNSRKICEITYARLQGLEALKEHFKNSKFACETDEYLPVVFSPPRDGRHLTEPAPIGGHADVTLKPQLQPLTMHDHDHDHDDDDGGVRDDHEHEHEHELGGNFSTSSGADQLS
ncbi:hypothetical protein Syun_020370 [Stephania yunnanensis]|uniref:RRM domain-containing protein n=1 Tax=Stephania yunnanensis TaxID=152371 RepID=A0AAP0NNT9_9MAGN